MARRGLIADTGSRTPLERPSNVHFSGHVNWSQFASTPRRADERPPKAPKTHSHAEKRSGDACRQLRARETAAERDSLCAPPVPSCARTRRPRSPSDLGVPLPPSDYCVQKVALDRRKTNAFFVRSDEVASPLGTRLWERRSRAGLRWSSMVQDMINTDLSTPWGSYRTMIVPVNKSMQFRSSCYSSLSNREPKDMDRKEDMDHL
uniref:Uncharacterized protein n=1 Tax=Steinernema glaseri TaxID=37863 RepID=A0A1I8ABI9_9BILA